MHVTDPVTLVKLCPQLTRECALVVDKGGDEYEQEVEISFPRGCPGDD
jgi:hypothetical protein